MPLRAGERRLEAGQPLGGDPRLQVGGAGADADRRALNFRRRLGDGDRVLVGLHHLGGDARPGEPLRAERGRAGHLGAPDGLLVEIAERLGERLRVTARHQHSVDPVTDDVAIAGDVRGDHGRARRERLGQDHPEALSSERRSAQHVAGLELHPLGLVVDLAEHTHVTHVEHQRRELVLGGADHGQLGRDVLAQRLERAQEQRQPLALDRLTDEHDLELVGLRPQRSERGSLGVDVDAVGDDPVVTAEEPPRGPRRGLRDRDPDVEAVEHPPCPQRGRDPVRDPVLVVGVERADDRDPRPVGDAPRRHRRQRLVDVDDVVVPGTELLQGGRHRVRGDRDVRDRLIGLQRQGPAERHQIIGSPPTLHVLRAGAAVEGRRVAAGSVVRGEHPNVVAVRDEALRERFDVPRDAPRIRPRVRRQNRYSHRV